MRLNLLYHFYGNNIMGIELGVYYNYTTRITGDFFVLFPHALTDYFVRGHVKAKLERDDTPILFIKIITIRSSGKLGSFKWWM